MRPEQLAKRKVQLMLAARNAERKAELLHAAAVRAKAAAKAARKSSKLARKAAKKAAKQARRHAKQLKGFLESAKAVKKSTPAGKPVAVKIKPGKAAFVRKPKPGSPASVALAATGNSPTTDAVTVS